MAERTYSTDAENRLNILVTGAQGFIGSHLLAALQGDHEIFALSHRQAQGTAANVHWIQQDLTMPLERALLPGALDAVVHLAQSEHFRDFPAQAEHIFRVNTMSTVHLLEYARSVGARTFILASSGGIYGYGDQEFSEDTAVASQDDLGFYLGTKFCAEVLAASYMPMLKVIMLRFFFVYGSGQRKSMLVPRLVQSVRAGRAITLQGHDGIRINPTYVSDAVTAIVQALKLESSQKINVGGPDVLSLRQIGQMIGQAVGRTPVFQVEEHTPPRHLVGDIQKMSALLSPPQVHFMDGIRLLVAQEAD